MLLLPRNVGEVAKLAGDDYRKFATSGVLVVQKEGGAYEVVATDSRYLGMVEGVGENPDTFPEVPGLKDAPDGATAALVPAGTFAEACKLVPTKVRHKPVLGHLAVVMGPVTTTMGATDLDRARTVTTRNVEGRFPAYGEVLKDLAKKPVRASVRLSATRLRELLAVAEKFADPDSSSEPAVDLEVRGKDDMVTLTVKNKAQKFTGYLAPMN
jgi:hypothetical protein